MPSTFDLPANPLLQRHTVGVCRTFFQPAKVEFSWKGRQLFSHTRWSQVMRRLGPVHHYESVLIFFPYPPPQQACGSKPSLWGQRVVYAENRLLR